MNNVKSISTGNSLIKTCTCILDAIYTSYDCIKFISTLRRIESNLSLNYYETVESLKEDIQVNIPLIPEEFIDSVESCKNPIPEEYSTPPIYSSIRLKPESKMYTVNIKTHSQLHSSIFDATNPLGSMHRLYLAKKENIEEIRDGVYSVLCLFADVQLKADPNHSGVSSIKANVVAVHVLGDFHPIESDQFEGWIKVKIAYKNSINTRLPSKLAQRLFEKREQIPRRINVRTATDRGSALYNELTHQFMCNVMQSSTKPFENGDNSLPNIENMLDVININNEHTQQTLAISDLESTATSSTLPPSLYKSSSTLLNSIATPSNNSSISRVSGVTQTETDIPKNVFITPIFANFWKTLEKFCYENDARMVHKSKYDFAFKRNMNASGFFKHVYFTEDIVLQIFQRSTASQRIIEIASLLALKDKPYIGRIKEVIYDADEVIGLTMDRYEMTLKDYLHKHTHQRLNAEQRMHIILQMLESVNISHQAGIAHRDLSTVNFMMNSDANLYLIDYGKAVFMNARDARRWWVESDNRECYKEDVKADTREELAVWCRNLPYVMAKPDHGYRFYRSIQTLPKSERDRKILPHLIDPAAEDIYSLGTMIWKIFSGLEPWPGVFDTDLKKLRDIVKNDYSIDNMLDRSMPGPMSKMFMQMFLRVQPQDRMSAADILYWVKQDNIKSALIEEWSANNGSRRTAAKNNIHCRVTKPQPTTTTPVKVQPAEKPVSLTASDPTQPRKRGRPRKYPRPEEEQAATNQPADNIDSHREERRDSTQVVHGSHLKQHTYIVGEDGIKRFAKSGTIVGRRPRANSIKPKLPPPQPPQPSVSDEPVVKRKRGRPRIIRVKEEYTEPASIEASQPSITASTTTVNNSNINTSNTSTNSNITTTNIFNTSRRNSRANASLSNASNKADNNNSANSNSPNNGSATTTVKFNTARRNSRATTPFLSKSNEAGNNNFADSNSPDNSIPSTTVKFNINRRNSRASTSEPNASNEVGNNAFVNNISSNISTSSTTVKLNISRRNSRASASQPSTSNDVSNNTSVNNNSSNSSITATGNFNTSRRNSRATTSQSNTSNETGNNNHNAVTNTTEHRSTKRSASDDIDRENRKKRHLIVKQEEEEEDQVVTTTTTKRSSLEDFRSKLNHTRKEFSRSSFSPKTGCRVKDRLIAKAPSSSTSSPSSRGTKDPVLLIKLPSQPKKVLDQETMELVNRSSLANFRDHNRSKSATSSPRPAKSYLKHDLSPPSPQSPALSPVSITETVDEVVSPVSPVPTKRKYEHDHFKVSKRRSSNQDGYFVFNENF